MTDQTPPKRSPPAMSIILSARDGFSNLRPILTCLAEQTIADQIEIIAVIPRDETPNLPERVLNSFHSLVPVVIGPITNRGEGAADGVAHATAQVIAFSENHCFPDPTWAEASLPYYDDPTISGVAPVVDIGNPEWGLSWACYATGYADYVTQTLKDVTSMPPHNTTYRASELHHRANQLKDLLRDERAFQAAILEDGGRFIMAPEARTAHINEGTWYLSVGLNYVNGNKYGASKAKNYGWLMRLARAAAFPLASIPIFRNSMQRLRRVGGHKHLSFELIFGLIAMALAHAFGEACAFLGHAPKEFKFLEDEVYMISERLGGHTLSDPRLAGFVSLAQ